MKPDKYTIKTQEALQDAQSVASEHGHQEISPAHLLVALLDQKEGITQPLLQKIGVQVDYQNEQFVLSKEPTVRANAA